jgi:dTDP-4-amino-4,6-dideoxygalactose transaminase
MEEVETPITKADVEHSWHLYVLRLNTERLRYGRDEIVQQILDRGVTVSVHFIPLHMFTYYRDTYGFVNEDFPVATAEFERYFSLPIYSAMPDRDVDDIVEIVTDVIAGARN